MGDAGASSLSVSIFSTFALDGNKQGKFPLVLFNASQFIFPFIVDMNMVPVES